jgi:hypothetical protein
MATAQLIGSYADVAQGVTAEGAEGDLHVRLEVHDASRLEWLVAVPFPDGAPLAYGIEVEMELPSNTFGRHKPWDQMQSFTRLDGGALLAFDADVITIDSLRRGAVALANKMARASEGFARHCLVSASLFTRVANEDLEQTLSVWLEGAIAMAEEARAKLVGSRASDIAELLRERQLVDEYVSLRLLDMLAGAERGLDVLSESRAPQAEGYKEAIEHVASQIADALERETAYRSTRGYICPDPSSSEALERFLERSSRLKKHFQEVLFLEPEVYEVAERLHHWVAAFVAVIASTWAFVWQLALMNSKASASSTVGSGIVFVAVIAGIIYATKDRLKEMGRTWISGNVHRFYAQRVARYRAPARRLSGRDVVVTARESFDQRVVERLDPLNPESGAKVAHTLIRYTHKGKVEPKAALSSAGVKRIKHVFRYDFSPLFARLDDPIKQVPVLDKATHRVRFTAAPRCYRFPVRVSVQCAGRSWEERVTVVLHKGGLDRLEREV